MPAFAARNYSPGNHELVSYRVLTLMGSRSRRLSYLSTARATVGTSSFREVAACGVSASLVGH